MAIKNKRLTDEDFQRERKEVLSLWPTGREVDIDEAIEYHKRLPKSKIFAKKFADAKSSGITLLRTSSGLPSLEEQVEVLMSLQEAGADVLECHVDSMTRNLRFEEAQRALEEGLRLGRPVLNGFPVVAHGVNKTRALIESVGQPVMVRAYTMDTRLVAEIGFAAGATETICAPLGTFCQYSKTMPLETSIRLGQYVGRLVGYYEEHGAPLVLEVSGGLCTSPTPPSIMNAGRILEAILAAEQGVKRILFLSGGAGNVVQEVVSSQSLLHLASEYLSRFGNKDVEFYTSGGTFGGKWPEDKSQAYGVICYGVMSACLTRATLCTIKTIEEAITIPSKEHHAASMRAAKQVVNMLRHQRISLDKKTVQSELKVLDLETRAIIDRVIELGEGDVALGAIRAYEAGVLDMPFATNRYVCSKIIGVRDAERSIRYWDHGNLPFGKDIVEFHRQKISEREKADGKKIDYETIIEDLFSVSRGYL